MIAADACRWCQGWPGGGHQHRLRGGVVSIRWLRILARARPLYGAANPRGNSASKLTARFLWHWTTIGASTAVSEIGSDPTRWNVFWIRWQGPTRDSAWDGTAPLTLGFTPPIRWPCCYAALRAEAGLLHARVHSGAYRALPSRRRYIP